MIDSSTLSWLRSEFVVFALAALGGVVVIIGLCWEYKSTDETRYEKADIGEFRSLKALEKRGERWVIAGIIIEVIVAVLFALRDDWHIKQMIKDQANADTRNLPIQSIKGFARIKIRPKEGRETEFATNLHQAWNGGEPEFSDLEMKKGETVLLTFWESPINGPSSDVAVIGIVAQVVFVGTEMGKVTGVRRAMPYVPNICFDLSFNNPNVENLNAVTFNELKYVQISGLGRDEVLPPLQVLGGEITLVAGAWPKTFLIPPQTNQFWRVSCFETNGEFVAAGYGTITNSEALQK
jgi:hypothetical protein